MLTSKGQKFPKQYSMTSGAEVVVANVQVPDTTVQVQLLLIDTGGNDLFRDQVPSFWNGVYHAILVFDISNQDSFTSCKTWFELLKSSRLDRDRSLKAVLVANKTDLPLGRQQVRIETAQEWAQANGMDFCEVSAVPPGKDVEAPFLVLAKAFHKSYEDRAQTYLEACKNYSS